MSGEVVTSETPAPAQPSASAPSTPASELPSGAAPATDGGAAPEQTQQQQTDQQQPVAPAAPEPAQPQQEGRANRRFSDLSRERNQALQEAAYWRGVAEAARTGQQPPAQPQATPTPAQPSGPPNPADYPGKEYDPRYAADLAKHEIRMEQKAEAERQAEADRQAAENRAIAEGRTRWETVCQTARAAGEGFENAETVLTSRNVPRSTMDLITTSDNPVHVAEYFGRKPDDLRAVLAMPPLEQARAITRLDARISANLDRARAAAPASPPAPTPAPAPQQPSPVAIPTAPLAGAPPRFNPAQASPSDVDARLAELKRQRGEGDGAAWSGSAIRL
jgi:hypothetical protein